MRKVHEKVERKSKMTKMNSESRLSKWNAEINKKKVE